MQLNYAFLCERTETRGSKLNAYGVGLQHIRSAKLPRIQPKIQFVASVHVLKTEMGRKSVELRVIDEDGNSVHPPLVTEVPFIVKPASPTDNGIDLDITINDVKFTKYGTYAIHFLIADKDDGSHTFSRGQSAIQPVAPSYSCPLAPAHQEVVSFV